MTIILVAVGVVVVALFLLVTFTLAPTLIPNPNPIPVKPSQPQPYPSPNPNQGSALTTRISSRIYARRRESKVQENAQMAARASSYSFGSEQQPATVVVASSLPRRSDGGGKQFAAFVSHAKADASMEARYLQTELEKRTRRRVFLDSDDLRDLSQLTAHVLDSDAIIIVQSANVLSRPYCLLELYTAITQGVPVVGVTLASGSAAHSYSFEESARFLTHLDSLLEQNHPGASQLLTQNGVDMEHCAYVLSCTLPKIISTKLEPGASQNILQATLDDIAATMRNASLPTLPPKEEWLRSRNAAAFTGPTLAITLTESLTVTLTLTESLTLTLSLNPTPGAEAVPMGMPVA